MARPGPLVNNGPAQRPMKNIGPASSRWLAAVGIHSLDDLRAIGVVNAYALVRGHGYNASLNLLWALQGAVTDVHWSRVPPHIKQELRQRLKDLS